MLEAISNEAKESPLGILTLTKDCSGEGEMLASFWLPFLSHY